MASIGLGVEEFDRPLPMQSDDGCISISIRSYMDKATGWLFSKDTLIFHGTPEQIHAFGLAIVKATEGLVKTPEHVSETEQLRRDMEYPDNAVTEDYELGVEAP